MTIVEPHRRRRRWPWVLAIVVVVVLVAAFFVADAAGRAYAKQQIADKIGAALGVPASSLTVTLAPTPLPIQLLDGTVDSVDVSSPSVTFGPLTGALTVHAVDVPLDQAAATRRLGVRYAIDRAQLQKLAGSFAGGVIQSVALQPPDVVASGTATVLGFGVPVGVKLRPAAVDGQLAFTASGVTVAGADYTAAQLASVPGLGAAVAPLLKQQTFCIAGYLPKALTVDSVAVTGSAVVVVVEGDGIVLGGSGLRTKGSCPGS